MIIASGDDIINFGQGIVSQLVKILAELAKNPRNPIYNHALFESIACCVKNMGVKKAESIVPLENALFQTFQLILQNEVNGSYCFRYAFDLS